MAGYDRRTQGDNACYAVFLGILDKNLWRDSRFWKKTVCRIIRWFGTKRGKMEQINKKEWIDYIARLNDRSISKRQATGFTNWAICGVIGILIFSLIDKLPVLLKIQTIATDFPVSLILIINCGIVLLSIYVAIFIRSNVSPDLRITPKLSKISRPILSIPIVFFCIIFSFLNFYVSSYANDYNISIWPFYVFGIFLFLQGISPIITTINKHTKNKVKANELPDLTIHPIFLSKFKMIADVIFLLIATILLVSLVILTYSTFRNGNQIIFSPLLKSSIEITTILFLTFLLLNRATISARYEYLESLERRILLENLDSKQIKYLFIQEIIGETLKEWVDKIKNELKPLHDNAINVLKNSETALKKLGEIDPEYEFEFKGRKDRICKEAEIAQKEYLDLSKKYLAHLRHLNKQQAFIFSEKDLFDQILNDLESSLKTIEEAYRKMCETCKITTKNLSKQNDNVAEQKGEPDC